MKKQLLLSSLIIFMISVLSFKGTDSAFRAGSTDSLNLFCPEDMEITLWAESPMFFNPTND
jgi:hypothetical protein